MIDTVIFDLDGTLLDTLDDLSLSVNHALGEFGLPVRSKEQIRRALGNGVRRLVEESVPGGTGHEDFERIFASFKAFYKVHSMDKTKPYEGIIPLLRQLKSMGYHCAIVSNKLDDAVQDLNRLFFADYIDAAIGESAAVKRKPAPDSVFEALHRLGSTRERAVYVGDSEVDFATAGNAGLPCVSVTWGFRDEEYLRKTGAETFIHRPVELLDWLENHK